MISLLYLSLLLVVKWLIIHYFITFCFNNYARPIYLMLLFWCCKLLRKINIELVTIMPSLLSNTKLLILILYIYWSLSLNDPKMYKSFYTKCHNSMYHRTIYNTCILFSKNRSNIFHNDNQIISASHKEDEEHIRHVMIFNISWEYIQFLEIMT